MFQAIASSGDNLLVGSRGFSVIERSCEARREQREVERLESRLVQRDDLIETMEIVFDVLISQIDWLLDDLPQRFDLVGEKEKYVREQVEDILPRMADIFSSAWA
jgi:hypothetical protein